jgi:nucleoid-associated protein YgaU
LGLFGGSDNKKKEKKKPDFSNVESGGSSTAPKPAPPPSAPIPPKVRTYVVQKGDSLSKIAKREYGNANAWPKIFEANRDIISDPDLIHPGQILKIPPAGGSEEKP